jgi:hypothetical protein
VGKRGQPWIPEDKGEPRDEQRAERLLEEIHYHLRGGDVSRRGLAFYLLDMERQREHKAYGCSSVIQFSDEVLETAPKETRDLLRIARALADLPEIDRAFGLGELSWSKVREITRVATAETEAKRLEFARGALSSFTPRSFPGSLPSPTSSRRATLLAVRGGERPPRRRDQGFQLGLVSFIPPSSRHRR